MRQTLYEFCCRNNKDLLLLQWDTEKNAPDTPQTVSYGSQRKIWWRCEKGHTWQAPVYSRTGGAGCPYCTGRRVGQGNDLASLYPALAAQWDLRKNAPRKPSDVLAGSHSPAWWLCEKGHSWQASVNSRLSGCGPVHGMSFPLGGTYHVPHGESNYMLFGAIMDYYDAHNPDGEIMKFKELVARILGYEVKNAIPEMNALLQRILPLRPLRDCGFTEADFKIFPQSVETNQQRLMTNAYYPFDLESEEAIYRKCY